MDKKEILKNKMDSKLKWEQMLAISDNLLGTLRCACGYCKIYTEEDDWGCGDCPLYSKICSPDDNDNSLFTQTEQALTEMRELMLKVKKAIIDDIELSVDKSQ